jgi:hypothetical protein
MNNNFIFYFFKKSLKVHFNYIIYIRVMFSYKIIRLCKMTELKLRNKVKKLEYDNGYTDNAIMVTKT